MGAIGGVEHIIGAVPTRSTPDRMRPSSDFGVGAENFIFVNVYEFTNVFA